MTRGLAKAHKEDAFQPGDIICDPACRTNADWHFVVLGTSHAYGHYGSTYILCHINHFRVGLTENTKTVEGGGMGYVRIGSIFDKAA